jgi:hypothetical protein
MVEPGRIGRGHDKSSSQVSGISEHKGNDTGRRVFRGHVIWKGKGRCTFVILKNYLA